MSEHIPLAYASPELPGERMVAGVRRAVAWIAITYGIASVLSTAANVAYMFLNTGSASSSIYNNAWLSMNVLGALMRGLLAVAGWMLLKRVSGGVKLLRTVCWMLVVVPLLLSLMVNVVQYRSGLSTLLWSSLNYIFSAVTGACLPGLMLLLPLRGENE